MNESEIPSICTVSLGFWHVGNLLQWSSINIVMPCFIIIGMTGHLISCRAFLKQAKNEKAYVYQIYLTVAGILSLLSFVGLMLGYEWSEQGGENGLKWFQTSYILMFYTGHLSIPLCSGFSIVTLLLSVSMAADRIFAFVKPFVYKNINRKRHQAIALTSSVLIAFAVVMYNCILFDVVATGDSYVLQPNIAYLMTTTATALAYVCNVTRVIGLSALIGCNVALIRLYRHRMTHVAQLNNGPNTDVKKEEHKKSTEKTLTLLTLWQSLFTGIGIISYVIFYTASYTVPTFNICEQHVFAPLLDVILMICDTANTCATVLVNKKTRRVVHNFISFFRGWKLVKEEQPKVGAASSVAPSTINSVRIGKTSMGIPAVNG